MSTATTTATPAQRLAALNYATGPGAFLADLPGHDTPEDTRVRCQRAYAYALSLAAALDIDAEDTTPAEHVTEGICWTVAWGTDGRHVIVAWTDRYTSHAPTACGERVATADALTHWFTCGACIGTAEVPVGTDARTLLIPNA